MLEDYLQGFWTLQVVPEAHAVGPECPMPPHRLNLATNPVGLDAEPDAVRVEKVVGRENVRVAFLLDSVELIGMRADVVGAMGVLVVTGPQPSPSSLSSSPSSSPPSDPVSVGRAAPVDVGALVGPAEVVSAPVSSASQVSQLSSSSSSPSPSSPSPVSTGAAADEVAEGVASTSVSSGSQDSSPVSTALALALVVTTGAAVVVSTAGALADRVNSDSVTVSVGLMEMMGITVAETGAVTTGGKVLSRGADVVAAWTDEDTSVAEDAAVDAATGAEVVEDDPDPEPPALAMGPPGAV